MLRRSLAVLLVLSWIILSGFDVVEDLDLPDAIELCNSKPAEPSGAPWSCRLVNNIVESANASSGRDAVVVAEPVVGLAPFAALPVSHTKLKLHKLHAIFLI
jgi:hypothetical protein